ncbi:inositol 2-dehydrogenase [Variovorax sp. ZS18.2.2]|uniref:inositol 2-dehydrogenase n=1 Tax=Variovorax sp. ZS18.2.2 TaxID=2971255 RepID=UPI0021507D9D|nr:inositol 2-dehydrogenase [Variovorax sp. ZS18.2.2]MCR6475253.1 inositol 2-dehydrogenase [Variovorax sp. ZS18.2.2]
MKQVAVFGAGRIGQIHASNLAALPGVQLRYISDPAPQSAASLAQALDAQVASIEQALADPAVDAVVIASPTTTHSDLIVRAAQAGKHIFCEKPVDLSVARAEACAAAVRQTGVACMIGFQRRFDPTFNALKSRLDDGEIGVPEVLVVTSRDPGAPPVEYLQQSGGIFRDMLIHDFDVFRWILADEGRDEAVWLSATGACLTDPAIAGAGDIDTAIVSIRTRSGRLCQINTSRRAAYGYDQRFEVLGSKGLLAAGNHRPTEVVCMDATGVKADNPEAFFLERYRAAYRLELAHFFERLQSGGAFRTSVHDGVAAQKLADAAALSFERGQPVTFEA